MLLGGWLWLVCLFNACWIVGLFQRVCVCCCWFWFCWSLFGKQDEFEKKLKKVQKVFEFLNSDLNDHFSYLLITGPSWSKIGTS